jgi:hypothetical protein
MKLPARDHATETTPTKNPKAVSPAYGFKPWAAFLALAPLNFTGRSSGFGFWAFLMALARATASRLKSGL